MALAAVIESMFVVMGQPNLSLRQCPLAMDKWSNLVVAEHQLALGLVIDSKNMVVKMTKDYLADTLDLIKSTWPTSQKYRKRFTALEASKLVGKLGRLREGAPWSRYMVSQLYSSIAFALAQNKETLSHSSSEFKRLVETTKYMFLVLAQRSTRTTRVLSVMLSKRLLA